MARTLYHYEQSVFSRRTRLVLAAKNIEVELKEARIDPANAAAARSIQPIRTIPVFVDSDRTAIADSNAILQYVELVYPSSPPLIRKEALPVMVAIDVALNALVDLGTRLFDLRNDPAWAAMKDERIARAHDAIAAVAAAATKPYLAGDSWSAADIWAYAATRWISGFPARIESSPAVKNMLTLGFELPAALVTWSKQHDARPDVRSIYGA